MSFWRKPKKIGIALSGGGARGLAHLGVLDVLEREGIHISAVAGTSMGSVIGALYCSGITVKEILKYATTYSLFFKKYYTGFNLNNLPASGNLFLSSLLIPRLAVVI